MLHLTILLYPRLRDGYAICAPFDVLFETFLLSGFRRRCFPNSSADWSDSTHRGCKAELNLHMAVEMLFMRRTHYGWNWQDPAGYENKVVSVGGGLLRHHHLHPLQIVNICRRLARRCNSTGEISVCPDAISRSSSGVH